MSEGFQAHSDHIGTAAGQVHGHADRVASHAGNLDAATRGRLLGRGKYGQIVEKAVRPIVDSMITDMSKAMEHGHRSIGHGLEMTKKNLDDAEERIRKTLRKHADGERDPIKLKPGQNALGEDGMRDQYERRVATRIDALDKEGHGVGRHLDVTDDQLKDRLGTPVMQGPAHAQVPAYDNKGYVVSTNKIDPLHGPKAKEKLQPPDLYLDADVKPGESPRNHKCGTYATAFGDNESFMYADQYARGRIPETPPHEVTFSPGDAWGPGDHSDRLRGYYVDPKEPLDAAGNVRYRNVDFTGATIKAIYRPDGNGGFKLHTMFPEPLNHHNPGR
ncbi:hypothetical protein C7C46_05870 [Streptomyces tateyamensis]|uniref:Uncharacterized protein n=1 Tax=Streptomyces tateyamensis TaxID=565073 RepID=A0A2V4NME1_9ACTN|nr:hypothetical protein [Streptomyces tateyamensis]PYC86161.1 hypothetical protein C7C46_05870 [Streptomyces tateyamensis]